MSEQLLLRDGRQVEIGEVRISLSQSVDIASYQLGRRNRACPSTSC